MNPTIDILRGELERLFSLEEMTTMSQRLLGLDPDDVGGTSAKGSFARALTERCVDGERIEALVDVLRVQRRDVDPRVFDIMALLGKEELSSGRQIGEYTIQKKLGESDLSAVYLALKGGEPYALKLLRREASRDRRAVHRFLTANRLVAGISHAGLPTGLEAGEIEDGIYFVAYRHIEGQPLAARFGRTGASHVGELKPILRGILEPLAAMHKAQLAHGDLKMENVLLARDGGVVLIDFGTDRLRHRGSGANGKQLAVIGSPRTIAPEIVRGKIADAKADVYAFGALLYELVSGKPVFDADTLADAAVAHLSKEPEPPSAKAPRGWIAKDLDQFVLSLLQKDPARRPKDATALLEAIETMGRASMSVRPAAPLSAEKIDELFAKLEANPLDADAAMAVETATDQGADATRVGEALLAAAEKAETETDEGKEAKKALLFRAARSFDHGSDKARAETTYLAILELDPSDDAAFNALEGLRKSLGKYEELVEMLLERSQTAPPGKARARALAEIGRLYATELDDTDQSLVAYAQALCEVPDDDEVASEIERLAGQKQDRWNEALGALTEAIKQPELPAADRTALLVRAARWYEQKLSRADLALLAFQQVLAQEPSNEAAAEGLTGIYRKAQQWPELAALLISRAEAAANTPKSRDLRVEAAELLETKLSDTKRASDIFSAVLADDPGHVRAGDALARIAERTGDFQTYVRILGERAEARRGREKAEALCKVAEVYEDHLSDLAEATRRFEAVLAIDPSNLTALKGLDRIYNRTGRYRELLEVLDRQIQVAATPRQKINILERMSALHDEEFLDHAKAAECLEDILVVDPSNDNALTSLARHYRALDKWEKVVSIYEKHASLTTEDSRKVELLVAKARTLAEQIGSPERATKVYEQALALKPDHAGALEAIAQLRELSGDAHAALSAIEALALKAETPEAKGDQWMRAGRLLEARGDKDGAIERYKLALEANPKDAQASAALRKAYAHRGDAQSVVGLVERELQFAEGDLAKARLHAELARVWKSEQNLEKAQASAKRAIELDASNAEALLVLGDLAFEAERMLEASKLYESLVTRTQVLPREDAVRVLVRYIEAFGKTNRPSIPSIPPPSQLGDTGSVSSIKSIVPPSVTNPRMLAAIEALKEQAQGDVEALSRAASALFDFGDPQSAYKMHEDLLARFGGKLVGTDRAEALYHLGESARRSGDLTAAEKPLKEAADLDPSNPRPFRALAKVYDALEKWPDAVAVRKRRVEVATGTERFELLLEIGDIQFQKQQDRASAQKNYVAALQEKPDDRKLLTKLMQLYSEEQNWEKLIDVVTRLADFVEDAKQRAKYMHTAATIAGRQLKKVDQAISFYEKALGFDPSIAKAVEELLELYREKGDHTQVERMLKAQLESAKNAGDRAGIVKVLDQLGDLYQKHLKEPELAIDAYEAAQAFDPEDKPRQEKLAELYASDPAQYLDKAVRAQAQMLQKNPYRVESYKLLRKLFTEAKKPDPAWCLCQALAVLKLAEPDEERFYKKHRAENAAAAQAALGEEEWAEIAHPELDPLVTRIFALIQPTIIRTRTQPLETLGYDSRYAIDTSLHPYPVSQTLYYVQGVLGLTPPPVFQNPNDTGSLGFVHASTPSVVLGRAAFELAAPTQVLAFLTGRHLAYFRPGFYVRQLIPTGTGLKAWLFAAIKLVVPQFPVSTDLQGQVDEALAAMNQDFQGQQRDILASLVSKLLQAGGALDLKRWVASIDYTADRAGFLVAHDLQVTTETMRTHEDGASMPVKERMKELVLFSTSESYFSLRQKLSIAIDS